MKEKGGLGTLKLAGAKSEEDFKLLRELFREYAASLPFDLSFQNFAEELHQLPGEYGPPGGRVLLAFDQRQLAGCVALRKIDDWVCEMKRLYLRPRYRGKGMGRVLTTAIIEEAHLMGYGAMRLDTVPSMKEAKGLYRSLGFRGIEPYRHNPVEGAIFMELDLAP